MVARSQIEVFWKSWGPESPDDKQEFEKLRNRVCTIVKNNVWESLWERYSSFREEFVVLSGASVASQDSNFWRSALHFRICEAEDMLGLMYAVQCLLWALHAIVRHELPGIAKRLNAAFEMSPNVLAHIALSAEGPTLYPGGAKILDDALIADNLEWLGQHPVALKSFREALSIFLSKDANKYRNLLDNLRFSVEQLLCDLLENQKSLENQKEILLPWMKAKGLHANVISMYHDLLFKHFAIYQNDTVKHGEKYSFPGS
jgi:dsDNA-binding SOS-regulon protein